MLPPGVCLSTLVLRVSSREEAEISGAADAEKCPCPCACPPPVPISGR